MFLITQHNHTPPNATAYDPASVVDAWVVVLRRVENAFVLSQGSKCRTAAQTYRYTGDELTITAVFTLLILEPI
jgi:hypothetical protein